MTQTNCAEIANLPKVQRCGLYLLGTLLVVGALFVGYILFDKRDADGLTLYTKAAARMTQGESIYRMEEGAFTYPPLFAVPFVAFLYVAESALNLLWYVLNITLLVYIFYRLHRRVQPVLGGAHSTRSQPTLYLFWIVLGVMSVRFVLAPLQNSSHDLLLFFVLFCAIDAYCSARPIVSAVGAGIAAALKATPLLFAPWYLWQRKFVAFAVCLLVIACCCFLPDVLFPSNSGQSWIGTWHDTYVANIRPGESAASKKAWVAWNNLNQSLAGTLYRIFTPPPGQQADLPNVCYWTMPPTYLKRLILVSQLAILAGLLWTIRPSLAKNMTTAQRSFHRLGEGGMVLAAMVLLSPMSSKSHFCVLLVPFGFCLADYLTRQRTIVATVTFTCCAVLLFTGKDLLGKALGDHILAFGSMTWVTVMIFFLNGRVLLQRSSAVESVPLDSTSKLASGEVFKEPRRDIGTSTRGVVLSHS